MSFLGAKYFSPPLTDTDRKQISHRLGLASLYAQVSVSYPGPSFPRWVAPHSQQGLVPELFPFPLNLFLVRNQLSGFRFEFPDKSWELSLQQCFQALEGCAYRFTEFEVSLLSLGQAENCPETFLPLLFHFVRGNCVRVGTSPQLVERVVRYQRGEISLETLLADFGTSAAYYHLRLPDSSLPCDEYLEALGSELRSLASLGAIRPTQLSAPHPSLRVEL